MSYFDAFFLGIVQGLTEFLPVSSSGHLVFFEKILKLKFDEASLTGFDVILHFGSLLAILIYFKKDLVALIQNFWQAIKTKTCNSDAQLFRNLILATIPALIVGFFWGDFLDEHFRSFQAVGWMWIITGILLILGEKFPRVKTKTTINLKQAMLIGCAQAFGLVPSVSRSGACMAMAMGQGIKREESARFAFLLAIPAIMAATGYVLLKAFLGEVTFPALSVLAIGFFTSLLISYLCIKFLMQFIKKHSLSVFSYYLFAIGLFLIFS